MTTSLPFDEFYWARYEFIMSTQEPLLMPAYKGATLRGSFGTTLKRISCFRDSQTCDAKPPDCQCPYGHLFAPKAPSGMTHLRTGEEAARPFVIEPPRDAKREYQPGETLTFHLSLFGNAVNSLPYFLVAFNSLPPMGIPPHRGRMQMHEIWAVNDLTGTKQRIYTHADRTVQNLDNTMRFKELADRMPHASRNRVTIQLITPMHLQYLSQEVRRLEFPILISRLLQRVETLALLYHDPAFYTEAWRETAKRLNNQAKTVQIAHDQTQWHQWKRFSTRQHKQIPMHGLIGDISYEGELEPFLPLLALGQYTHVGKNGVFGMGKYQILP